MKWEDAKKILPEENEMVFYCSYERGIPIYGVVEFKQGVFNGLKYEIGVSHWARIVPPIESEEANV